MPKISQNQELSQNLTPQQVIQAKILQMGMPVLEQKILKELEINPALELIDNEEYFDSDLEVIESENEDEEFDIEELLGDPDSYEPMIPKQMDGEKDITLVSKQTILEKYLEQLIDANVGKNKLNIGIEILGNLDEQGYLTIDPILLADRLECSEDSILEVMAIIQHLDPPGLAARDIRECLLAQSEVRKSNKFATLILKNYFNDFINKRYNQIIENLKCSKEELEDAINFISKLNPSPREEEDSLVRNTIVPDLSVFKIHDKWEIQVQGSELSQLQISSKYLDMLSDKNNKIEVKNYLKKKIDSANWFITAIKERKNTIIKVMESIINRQKNYFENDNRELIPMILKDIAIDINMDISTISRVTNSRYVQLPWGIKELKTFFSESISKKDGTMISNTIVKKHLKKIIQSEDKLYPISDEKLTNILNKEGYKIARRTVSKYREELKLPTSRLRKKIG